MPSTTPRQLADRVAWALTLLCLTAAGAALAGTLRICVDATAHPPYSYPDRDGEVQRALRRIAADAGWQVLYVPRPLRRCREDARRGKIDAYFGLTYLPGNREMFHFPLSGNAADPARAIGMVRTRLFKRVGSALRWDGKRLSHLDKPLLFATGLLLAKAKARALGAAFDDGASTSAANLHKLIERRGDAAVLFDAEGAALAGQAPFAGQVVAEGPPFTRDPVYLPFSTQFLQQHPHTVETIWAAIGRTQLQRRQPRAPSGPAPR